MEKDPKKLKWRLPKINSLAMLKMEKNFIAYCEKNYPRQPYQDEKQPIFFLLKRIIEETQELCEAYCFKNVKGMKEECADISNLIDYVFEKLLRGENL
jgi:NTP pyrophosphatase (non-canonical NTP hydrolase)